jgi:hypothetical protein
VLELDEHADERMRQDEVLAEAANASANRRPMIVE